MSVATSQPIGKTFGIVPCKVASFYFNLPNPKYYTGRRTSATAIAYAGASMTNFKRHGG